jgi:N6-L-threonylcarbamoyladenine synthase
LKILAIDTSCDDTAVSLLEDDRLIKQFVSSQANIQSSWGGVVPVLAQREHTKRMEWVIAKVLLDCAKQLNFDFEVRNSLKEIIIGGKQQQELTEGSHLKGVSDKSFRGGLADKLQLENLARLSNPGIDMIAVTVGPGLSIALGVGIEAARILASTWGIPVVGVNHVEGHLWSALIKNSDGNYLSKQVERKLRLVNNSSTLLPIHYPALGLIVSGGHTEVVEVQGFGKYEVLAQTLDDAAGEAFDKFAVMLGLGYPGGPVVESLAREILVSGRLPEAREKFPLPVAMQKTKVPAYSFSGLKTAALYLLQKKLDNQSSTQSSTQSSIQPSADATTESVSSSLSKDDLAPFCASFQETVIDSIILQLRRVLGARRVNYSHVLTGGGVMANQRLRARLRAFGREIGVDFLFPHPKLLADNASMIGLVGFYSGTNYTKLEQLDRNPGLTL